MPPSQFPCQTGGGERVFDGTVGAVVPYPVVLASLGQRPGAVTAIHGQVDDVGVDHWAGHRQPGVEMAAHFPVQQVSVRTMSKPTNA